MTTRKPTPGGLRGRELKAGEGDLGQSLVGERGRRGGEEDVKGTEKDDGRQKSGEGVPSLGGSYQV